MSSQGFDPAWALRPEGLQLVTRLVAAGRRNVVECGSGESTVAVARALRDLGGGHVHSLEHLPGWASRTRDVLASERLDRFATVIDAPLVDGWYDPAAADRLPEAGIDLLLVDGPPAGELGHERARYPALPRLADRLMPDAAIVLDDADREGERWVLDHWLAEFPLDPRPAPRGIALALYVPATAGTSRTTTRRGRYERNS